MASSPEVEHLLLGLTAAARPTSRRRSRASSTSFAIADDGADRGGYVGEDENILLKLIQAMDFDIKKAQTGIIYIDEAEDRPAGQGHNPRSRATSPARRNRRC